MGEGQWEEACQLSQDADDDFDWRIGHRTETPGAGPETDHSPGEYPLCLRHQGYSLIEVQAQTKLGNVRETC